MKRTKKKCQMLLAGLLTLMMVFTMWSPSMVYADETVITNDENGIPDEKLYNKILQQLGKSQGDTFTVSEAESIEALCFPRQYGYYLSPSNLSGIENLKNLKTLELNGADVDMIMSLSGTEGLAKLENLETVKLFACESYSNIISQLPTNLKVLELGYTYFKDYDALSGLSNLTELYLNKGAFGEQKSDISVLSQMTHLKKLKTAYFKSDDINVLLNLTNLEELSFTYAGLSDISVLSELTSLKELKVLDLSNNKIVDFSPVRKLEMNGVKVIKDNQSVSLTGSTMIDGVETRVTIKAIENAALSSAQQTAIDKVLNADSIEDMQKELIKDTAGVNASAVKYYKLLDISLPSGTDISAGVPITLKDSSVKAGMNIVMLHLKADGTWENIPVIVADGEITGTFTSLSPVYYFAVEEGTGTGFGSGSGENTGTGEGTGSVSVSTKYEPAEITFTGSNGKAMRWISSEKDGNISISGLQTVIADGAKFYAEKVKSTAIANAVAEAKGDVPYVAYDFTLTVDGEEVATFAEHVDVSMPIPDGFDLGEGQTVTVYYYNNGKLEKCNTAVSDGFVTFGTTHFSTFVYVQESAASAASTPAVSYTVSPKTGDNSMVSVMAVLAVAVFGGMVYCLNKRRSY